MSLLIFVPPASLHRLFSLSPTKSRRSTMSSLEGDNPIIPALLNIFPPLISSIWIFRSETGSLHSQRVIRSLKINSAGAFENYPPFFRFVCVPRESDMCHASEGVFDEQTEFSQITSDSIGLAVIFNCVLLIINQYRLILFRFLIRSFRFSVSLPFRSLRLPFFLWMCCLTQIRDFLARIWCLILACIGRVLVCIRHVLVWIWRGLVWLCCKICCIEPDNSISAAEHDPIIATRIPDSYAARLESQVASIPPRANYPGPQVTTTHRRIDDTQDLIDYRNSLKPSQEELEKSAELEKQLAQSAAELERIQNQRDSLRRNIEEQRARDDEKNERQRVEMEREFQRKRDEINERYAAEIRARHEERARIERESEEERLKMREESARRMQMFVQCVELKMRFEDRERECQDMLDGFRKPLVRVATSFHHLQQAIQRAEKPKSGDWEREEMQSVGREYARKVANAQSMLAAGFEHLAELSAQFEDRIFLRMIMKSLSEIGASCDALGQQLVQVLSDPPRIGAGLGLAEAVKKVSPHLIPSTDSLRRNSTVVNSMDYVNIPPPPYPHWFSSPQ